MLLARRVESRLCCKKIWGHREDNYDQLKFQYFRTVFSPPYTLPQSKSNDHEKIPLCSPLMPIFTGVMKKSKRRKREKLRSITRYQKAHLILNFSEK